MAKLIRIPKKTLFLMFLAILVFSNSAQAWTNVCDKPSQSHQGSCSDHKTCRDACLTEQDSLIFGGVCQPMLDQSAFTECVKSTMTDLFGVPIVNGDGCTDEFDRRCPDDLLDAQESCKKKNLKGSGAQCTCSYLCA